MKIILFLQKKVSFGANWPKLRNGPCYVEIGTSSDLWMHIKDCFFHNERGQEIYEIYSSGFSKKNLLRMNLLLWDRKCCNLRSGSALKNLCIILHNERGEELRSQ